MPLAAIVLAAGKGTRMRSPKPKVLHTVAGAPMIARVHEAALAAGAEPVVHVIGHGADEVRATMTRLYGERAGRFALQPEQRGTGHAVRCALPALRGHRGDVLLLVGDMPLLRAETLRALAKARARSKAALVVGTVFLEDAGSYGRVLRDDDGRVTGIVEAKDASPEERAIQEINTGLYAVSLDFLRRALPRLRPTNAQGELYLTDIVAMAARAGGARALVLEDATELQGVNSMEDLASAEADDHLARASAMMREGTRVADPGSLRVDFRARVEAGAILGAGVHLLGETHVAAGAEIGPGAILRDARIGAGAKIGPYAVLCGVTLEAGAIVEAHAVLGDVDARDGTWI